MAPEVLAGLIDRHAAALVLYARQWCAVAEDVVQEAMVKLASQRIEPTNVPAWLFRTVRNGAISAGRAEDRRRRHEAGAARIRPWFQAEVNAPVDAEEAARALQDLPPEEREIIVAHLWGGLTFEVLGEIAGCSTSTAHRRYLAGLAHLREKLGESCPITNQPTTIDSKRPCGN